MNFIACLVNKVMRYICKSIGIVNYVDLNNCSAPNSIIARDSCFERTDSFFSFIFIKKMFLLVSDHLYIHF